MLLNYRDHRSVYASTYPKFSRNQSWSASFGMCDSPGALLL